MILKKKWLQLKSRENEAREKQKNEDKTFSELKLE